MSVGEARERGAAHAACTHTVHDASLLLDSYRATLMPADKIYAQFVDGLPSMTGKCIAITGTTSGTGYWCARAAAKKGASAILLLNRKSERSDRTAAELTKDAPSSKIFAVECDLTSFDSVKRGAADAKTYCDPFGGIDVLLCNAAIGQMPDVRTVDGFDLQVQTNHLSHALLVEELMPCLEAAAKVRTESRIVFVSSGARFFPFCDEVVSFGGKHFERCEPGALGGNTTTMKLLTLKSPPSIRYNHSKLAMSTYAMALHEQLAARGSKVKSLVAEPGSSATDFIKKGFEISPGVKANAKLIQIMGAITACAGMQQSAGDGACPILAAGFDTDARSGDLYAPSQTVGSFPGYVKGSPHKTISSNQQVSGAQFSEQYTLNKEYQRLSWEKTRRAIGVA